MNAAPRKPNFSEADLAELRAYRLKRLREKMREADVALCVLTNPVNLRYAADFREYQMFQSHIPTNYLFVPAEGDLCMHGSWHRNLPAVADYRPSDLLTVFDGGFCFSRHQPRLPRHPEPVF
ncbi:MAG: aminopeptidase P family N-terminal domain-containing protein [Gammaproteobacteria bacterium]|nr:aminopeptidase P family N-terminal domain-containing protein [Gammaproteobacteria bacterium]